MVKVAAAQIPVTKNTEKNLNKIIEYIKKAASKNVDIICFPETSLVHSKNKNSIKKMLENQRFSAPTTLVPIKKYIDIIKKACKENKIHCIFGTNIIEKNDIFNVAFFVDDNGEIIYKYKKVNLWINERKEKVNGKNNKVVKTRFGKIGVIICWDIAYPEYVKKLGKQGAWIIFCPSYVVNYKRELGSYEQLPYARAFENSAYFVYCDAYAKDTVKYSYICGPSRIYAKIRNKEGMIVAELDRRKIMGLRRHYRLV